MDPETPSPPGRACTCACLCCSSCPSSTWRRSVKRKLDQMEVDGGPTRLNPSSDVAARVEVENEVAALREALARQQQSIQDLCLELDEERNASSTAASEAMSMILRLQREKAELQMEARQFKRFAEEKMAHDQQELIALDDLLFRRDQAVQSLSCEIKAYKHRLRSYGIDDVEPQTPKAEVVTTPQFDLPDYDYPPLRCTMPAANLDNYDDDETADLEKYTPRTLDHLQNLEHRIYQLETTPGISHVKVMEKAVVGPSSGQEFKNRDEFPVAVDHPSDPGREGDDGSDRVYTIDAVHGVPTVGVSDEQEDVGTLGEKGDDKGEVGGGDDVEDGDIKKLYMRLQALEADRESMRQAIISMRTEKAQLVLLKEIAQQLCKEVVPERRVVKKSSLFSSFSIASVIKWVVSFIFWRKKASRSKYTFGLSNNNVGLLLLLDKSPRMNQWRCLTRTRG